jgi:hypothetical protein
MQGTIAQACLPVKGKEPVPESAIVEPFAIIGEEQGIVGTSYAKSVLTFCLPKGVGIDEFG